MYLTDVIGYANRTGRGVGAHLIDDPWQTQGVNDRVQLAELSKELNRRILIGWMRAGVTVMDPETTWVADAIDLAEDVTLLPDTSLRGATSVGEVDGVGHPGGLGIHDRHARTHPSDEDPAVELLR